jgi:hypothetical protein
VPSFKDTNGREWIIKLDAPKIRDVRQECHVDLIAVDGVAFQQLADDPVLLVDALWVLCRAQAGGITPTQFGEALVGDAITAATDALLAAILDFTPTRQRTILQTLSAKNARMREMGLAQVMAELNDPTLEAKLLAKQQAEIRKVLTELTSVGNSPE